MSTLETRALIHGSPSMFLNPVSALKLDRQIEERLSKAVKDYFNLSPIYVATEGAKHKRGVAIDLPNTILGIYETHFPNAKMAIEDFNDRWAKLIMEKEGLVEVPRFAEEVPSGEGYSARGNIVKGIKHAFEHPISRAQAS